MDNTIVLLGGTGFVGRSICTLLAQQGFGIRIITRDRARAGSATLPADAGIVTGDVYDDGDLASAFTGARAVINLIGILNERGHDGSGFRKVHAELPARVAAACLAAGVKRLVHMSALHADAKAGPSHYLRTKGAGEDAVHAAACAELHVTSFQPSVIFGAGDSFINRFAILLRFTPLLFPLACPQARFAPVYVGDVARRFVAAIDDEETWDQRIPLCGPKTYSLLELVEYTARAAGRRRLVIGLPDALSKLQAGIFEWLPGKPLSLDNYNSLSIDSICEHAEAEPTTLESIVPDYIR